MFKFPPIPTPPDTTRAPFTELSLSVVFVIFITPDKLESVPYKVPRIPTPPCTENAPVVTPVLA